MGDILQAMKTAYIFHDSFCDPFSEWYPWMKATLEAKGYLVVVPKFPSPAGQSYESWKVVIKNYIPTFDGETLLIGHGTGGLFALRLAQESIQKIRGLFLVASYGEPIGNIGYDRINTSFYEPTLDWEKIKGNVSTVRIFAGEADPFVPAAISERLAEHLGETLETIPQGGHLGKAAGFTQLIPVVSRIFESLNELDKSIALEQAPKKTDAEVQVILEQKSDPAVPEKKEIVHNPDLETHTMYQDMSHLVNSNRGSVASSLLTEARKEEAIKEAQSPASGKNILYTLFSIFVFAAVAGIGLYLVQKYAAAPQVPPQPEPLSLIKAEDHQKITLSGEPAFILNQKIRAAFDKPVADDTFRDIFYATSAGRASFNDLLAGLAVSDLPKGFSDEFPISENGLPVFMHGVSEKNQVPRHFLVVRVKNYDIAFSLMRQWERTLLRDVGPLMGISPDFLKTRITKDIFQDEMVQNKNVRTLRYHKPTDITLDENTTIEMIKSNNPFVNQTSPYQENDLMISYFFLNEKTLIITDSLDIIPELLKRYANRQIYQ